MDIAAINETDLEKWKCCCCDPYIALINKLEKDHKSNDAVEDKSGPPILEEHDE